MTLEVVIGITVAPEVVPNIGPSTGPPCTTPVPSVPITVDEDVHQAPSSRVLTGKSKWSYKHKEDPGGCLIF